MRKAADEEGAGLDLAALEAEAAAAGTSELGSRKQLGDRQSKAKEAQVADEAQRQSKYALLWLQASRMLLFLMHCRHVHQALQNKQYQAVLNKGVDTLQQQDLAH